MLTSAILKEAEHERFGKSHELVVSVLGSDASPLPTGHVYQARMRPQRHNGKVNAAIVGASGF